MDRNSLLKRAYRFFSRIEEGINTIQRYNVDQLIFFLKRMDYPAELISFVEENRSNLDHLQYDVGVDYRMQGKDLVILKSGYYGIF